MARSRWMVRCAALLCVIVAGSTVTPRRAVAVCAGDCDEDGTVTVDELVVAASITPGSAPPSVCPGADADGNGSIFTDDILAAVGSALAGCAPATPTPSPTATPSPTPQTFPPPIPTESGALRAWLEAGSYLTWTAESALHRSAGPHGTLVRTFLDETVLTSLAAGNATHPAGSALVKELYFSTNTSTPDLWAVSIKTQDDSANGQNWYWWEGSFAGFGLEACVPCHRGDFGNPSRDFVLTPYPLQ